MNLPEFKKLPVLGILRAEDDIDIERLIEHIINSELKTIEIAMNSRSAPELIKRALEAAKNKLNIGAGTVLSMNILESALNAGATFIVTPILVKDVTKYCIEHHIPIFTGAFSPKEIYDAWNAGAAMVKVFPSSALGPSYFREIKGPFKEVKLLACGGINDANIIEYFSSGADAVAFGTSIFRREWLKERNFLSIENAIKSLLSKLTTFKELNIIR